MTQHEDDRTRSVVILATGTSVAHYLIEKKIGVGGMGEVYLARDTKLDRPVALKFLSAQFSSDKTFKDRFFREAKAAAKLNHPNIITIYEVSEFENRIYIAMEFVDGQTLREVIDSARPSLNQCLDIISQICHGMVAAHKQGLVHRDIKPSNIVIDENQRVRILDFGLAKQESDQQLTQAGTVLGTVNYMSPEQSRGEVLDHLSDMFSIGILAYELLTRQSPFKKSNVPATLHAIVNDTPAPLSSFLPEAAPELQALIDRSLQKRASNRFDNMQQMAVELDSLMGRSAGSFSNLSTNATIQKAASLAVLYLRNLGTPDDDFLSYGITEDLIIDISRIATVRVMPMRSILKFKDSDESLQEIATRLNVDFVLDGSIHRSEEMIRISAQLVEIANSESLWSDRWEQPFDSLPEIKKNLAKGISEALEFGQTIIRKAQLGISKVKHAGAYENYLRGKYAFEHKQDQSDVKVALEMYDRALEEEPSLLAAKIGIAEVHIYSREFEKAESELIAALEKAKQNELLPEQGDILYLLSRHHSQYSDWDKAREHGEQALKLKQELNDIAGEAEVLGLLISEAQAQGNFDEAIKMFDRVLQIARQLDDRDKIAEALKNMGVAFARKGEYDQANELYMQSLELAKVCENNSLQAACLSNIGNLEYFRGNLSQAYEQYEQACLIETRLGDRAGIARHTLNMGLVQLRRLQFREGLELLGRASKTFEELGDRAMFAMALLNESQARLTLGQVTQATQAAEKALEISKEIGHPLSHSNALLRIATVQFFEKEYEEAVDSYELARSTAEEAGISRNVALAELGLAETYFESGEIEKSKTRTAKALAVAREIGEDTLILKASIMSAVITTEKGLANMGIDQLGRLCKEAAGGDDTELTIYAQYQLGRLLLKHGTTDTDKTNARSTLNEALSRAREYELVPLIQLIENVLP